MEDYHQHNYQTSGLIINQYLDGSNSDAYSHPFFNSSPNNFANNPDFYASPGLNDADSCSQTFGIEHSLLTTNYESDSYHLLHLKSLPPAIENEHQLLHPVSDPLPFLRDIDIDEVLNEIENEQHLPQEKNFYQWLDKIENKSFDFDFAPLDNQLSLEQYPQDFNQTHCKNIYNFKRKNSIDSSECSSDSFFETSSQSSSSSTTSATVKSIPKKRNRRSKHSKEERITRKKHQNRKAASKYRSKIKVQGEEFESILEQLEQRNKELMVTLGKIQTEFDVILPLAKASFQFDHTRRQQLAQLINRLEQN
ncbi:hypothetical protein SSS_07139 [Sarcoptes scabiei]|uniref:BZIP domain-containing protein n=1 Tax=Sarcoptes scabiei TaxID=52283 RepID=A0A834R511_SARSC|nr:hypothetical protein SSS_07139 [Sarcoptes scabiei]